MTSRAEGVRRLGTLASVVWAGLVAAYGLGYVTTLNPGGFELVLVLLGFLAAAAVPVLLIRAIQRLSDALAAKEAGSDALHQRVRTLEAQVAEHDKQLSRVAADLSARAVPMPPPPPPPPAPPPAPPAPEPAAAAPVDAPPDPDPDPDPPVQPELPEQPDLPLEGGADAGAELSLDDTIRALNFPQNAQDNAGFAILRRALASHDLAKLLQASEDCLNLLAHQGIYMDDLIPAPATGDDWREFAKGGAARAALMPLTGITDGEALETVRSQMRSDPIFRDTALYFQRRFDQLLQTIAPEASDQALLSLVDTRTGRAFVLLVQVSGMSDALR